MNLTASELMSQNFGEVHQDLNLKNVFSLMNKNGWAAINVVDNDFQSIGTLDRTDLQTFIQTTSKKIRP
jgi:predicted transcriptional regulator